MQPEVVLLADVGDFVDGIEGAEHSRAGRRVHQERDLPVRDALLDQSLQFHRDHLSP